MHVRILGAAAGGGSPQWNCGCAVCAAVRAGAPGTQPRSQSSIAVRGSRGGWLLVNASPDLRQQIAAMDEEMRTSGRDGDGELAALRSTPFGAVLLTDAEIDHAAGLMLLRESSASMRLLCTAEVHDTLSTDYPLLRMLDDWCGIDWTELVPGASIAVPGSSLVVEPFVTGEDPPRYRHGAPVGPGASVGLVVRDSASPDAAPLVYCPCLEAWTDDIATRFTDAALVLVDGTFWSNDELVAQGIGTRDAMAMGHLPLDGPGGLLERLEPIDTDVVLVHINNSNPVLLAQSAERARLDERGIRVASDGMELELP